ncbi:MAG: fluoride efflux transporter CrcB [Chitinophagales bacterium]|nr:fluoride efflux transporter CrcB [Chitinophagales bacterium]
MKFLLVFVGGGLGSVVRYLLHLLVPVVGSIPVATLAANILASFVIGVGVQCIPLQHHLRLLLLTGFCGGLSTFSAFSLESFNLLSMQYVFMAMVNMVLNVALCLLAVFAGMELGSRV